MKHMRILGRRHALFAMANGAREAGKGLGRAPKRKRAGANRGRPAEPVRQVQISANFKMKARARIATAG